jgi:SAM-dependent methyltransferase
MRYRGLAHVRSHETPHLGGNINAGDPFTYAPSVWDYLISRFCLQSVLDIGSGRGYAATYFHEKGLQVVAVEGLQENVTKSLFPAIMHDLTLGPVYTRVDLAHCQEVVEHIEEQHVENLLNTLANGTYVVITHGLPGQGGYHHVNLQPPEYWIDHMKAKNYILLEEDTSRIKKLAERDGAKYLARTGLVFADSQRI